MLAENICRIEFQGLPPFKANPGVGRGRVGAQERQRLFKEAAQRTLKKWRAEQGNGDSIVFPWEPMTSRISLNIVYSRAKGENDSANIVGGICDALQGVFYADDRQVVGIRYSETTLNELEEDHLLVEVSRSVQQNVVSNSKQLEMGIIKAQDIDEDWDKQIDERWSARAPDSGDSLPGPQAAMDASKVLRVSKLSESNFKTLQGLLDNSEWLPTKWMRQRNSIIRK
ncbi:RusA family crossover junction endodeoxyribonuclease [Chloroflexota bacterium]